MSTTYMLLDLPTVGTTAGPTWATMLNAALTTIDLHDHSSNKGTSITPSGMNINSDLTFGNFSATNLKTACFSNQAAALASTFQKCLYVAGNDLYYNNGSGTSIQLTSGTSLNVGSVNGISGLASPASASFSTPDFVFKSASTTYGKLSIADIKLFEYAAGVTNAVTIKSPASLAASYSITMPPALPGSTQYVTMAASGALSLSTADNIGSAMTSTGSNAISAVRTRTTGTSVAAGGVAISSALTVFSTTSTTFVDVTNLSVTITTSGRPVFVGLIGEPSGGTTGSAWTAYVDTGTSLSVAAIAQIKRDTTVVSLFTLTFAGGSFASWSQSVPATCIQMVDAVSAGTYTYKVQVKAVFAPLATAMQYSKLVAYEL